MKKLLFFLGLLSLPTLIFAQPANNTCATATNLGTLTGDYTATPGNLYLAGTTATGSTCGTRYDVWYRFTLPAGSTSVIITVVLDLPNTGTGSLTTSNTYIELFNSSGCTYTTLGGCNNVSQSRKYTGLTSGGTYTFRVNTSQNPNVKSQPYYGFNLYVVPNNDECSNVATILPPGGTVAGSLTGATNSGVAVAPCTGTADDDIWYRFDALYSYATITLGNIGSDLAASGARMQLFSGTCGSLTSLACSGTTNVINANDLTPGSTYYVRVFSAGAGQTGSNWGFQISLTPSAKVQVTGGRMKEVFHQQIISAPQILADPWEVTYGPDNKLWVTESKGYRVYRVDPVTGVRDTVLNISQGSTFFTAPADQAFNAQFNIATNNPQGGCAGLALHPKFMDATTPVNYVYVSYVHTYIGSTPPTGTFYTNRLVRFTYNTGTGRLESPVSICDTLPGSNDHNSQRIIICPMTAGGTDYYLFYASGDLGAGQFNNRLRTQKAQNPASYEGKILRFNLASDGDAGLSGWIPNDNPYNGYLGVQSAVWSMGIRNNQGFAYDSASNILYGSSHGPYSDDELNIIEGFKNYGHPLVIGFANDANYNGNSSPGTNTSLSAGAPWTDNSGSSSCPPIGSETANRDAINVTAATLGAYKDPLFTAYAQTNATITNIWQTNPSNSGWPSEGWSGLDIYSSSLIPGWKKSLVAASLKWGRLVRLRLDAAGTATAPTNTVADTTSYFGSVNRFRDLAFAPNGKDIYVIMDRSTTTSGPSAAFPFVPACQGCLQKYTFLGYADATGKSSIPTAIDVTDGPVNTCNSGTTVVIDDTNKNLWVPITGPDGNILAEIYAGNSNGNLGTVTSSFYKNSGPIRIKNGVRYLDRNMTINVSGTVVAPVKIRLYISKTEFDALDADPMSAITGISDLKILKNSDPCSAAVTGATTLIIPSNSGADLVHGANGYVLQADITGFSSFYFASGNISLPLDLLSFTGTLQNNSKALLKWKTENEINTSHFVVERSIDGVNYSAIGTVTALGTASNTGTLDYSLLDEEAGAQQSLVLYYRLKMVDIDQAYKYSNIVRLSLADITGKIMVSPNPVSSKVSVNVYAPADLNIQWSLLDNTGRILLRGSSLLSKGPGNNFTIDMHKLPAGSYYLSVKGEGMDQQVKLHKL